AQGLHVRLRDDRVLGAEEAQVRAGEPWGEVEVVGRLVGGLLVVAEHAVPRDAGTEAGDGARGHQRVLPAHAEARDTAARRVDVATRAEARERGGDVTEDARVGQGAEMGEDRRHVGQGRRSLAAVRIERKGHEARAREPARDSAIVLAEATHIGDEHEGGVGTGALRGGEVPADRRVRGPEGDVARRAYHQTGSCWVMQCSVPSPHTRSTAWMPTTRRSGKRSARIASARRSAGSLNVGTSTVPLAT